MRKLVLVASILLVSFCSQAQGKKMALSVAVNAGIPVSTPSIYSSAVGADLQADFAATEGLKITASAGYENFSVKKGFGGGSTGIIPLLAGAKFNLGSEKLYGHAQLGVGFGTQGGGGTLFAYAPSIGYYFSPNFDASLKYLAFSNHGTFGEVGVRLAYNF